MEFNIDLNAKVNGKTGYDFSSGQVKKLILDNSAQFNIDLNNYVDPNLIIKKLISPYGLQGKLYLKTNFPLFIRLFKNYGC